MSSRSLAAPQAGRQHEVLGPAAAAGCALSGPSAARKRRGKTGGCR